MAAQVGLLSHNIRIIGEDADKSFGGCVSVHSGRPGIDEFVAWEMLNIVTDLHKVTLMNYIQSII